MNSPHCNTLVCETVGAIELFLIAALLNDDEETKATIIYCTRTHYDDAYQRHKTRVEQRRMC